jgi:hypothetical protein
VRPTPQILPIARQFNSYLIVTELERLLALLVQQLRDMNSIGSVQSKMGDFITLIFSRSMDS